MEMGVMNKIAKDMHVKLVVKTMDFNSVLVAVETGKADCAIGGINPTVARRQSVDFSKIYYNGGQSFLISSSDANKYKSRKDLQDKWLAVKPGLYSIIWQSSGFPMLPLRGWINLPTWFWH